MAHIRGSMIRMAHGSESLRRPVTGIAGFLVMLGDPQGQADLSVPRQQAQESPFPKCFAVVRWLHYDGQQVTAGQLLLSGL